MNNPFDFLATLIIVISLGYLATVVFLIIISYWDDICNSILKLLTRRNINIIDLKKSLALFKRDETLNEDKYHKTIKMSYRKFYKLWQSGKLDMRFDDYSIEISYKIEENDDGLEYAIKDYSIIWVTIYFSLFDTIFRYIPLRKSVRYYHRDTKSNERSGRAIRLKNRKQNIEALEESLKREE